MKATATMLTVRELAERWKVSRTTLWRMARRRDLTAHRIGGSIRFSLKEIERKENRIG